MKNVCFILALMLMGTFTFANTEVETKIKPEKIEKIIENSDTTIKITKILELEEEIYASCTDISFNWMDYALDIGLSVEVAGCLGNTAYALCTGWSASYNDCF
ncbi:hypothetical protein [Winogradskyella psychrotolerans]|uniref:hypothetical protein n=1 Tax=Winogradskyella psychrotolerans TaxID=1344585 RepID=UPI001C065DD5|nr:hypothetical protein [Winogradskyella psychrotolerans]MBU2928092.1 hypothetical protein [Winogradskyella psychrotolerans]